MNVLDLRGPAFLELYLVLMGAALALAFIFRWILRGPGGEVPGFVARLEPLEVACLARGPQGVADAVVADLVYRGAVKVDPKKGKLSAAQPLPPDCARIEAQVYDYVARHNPRAQVVRQVVRSQEEPLIERLRASQLMTTGRQAMSIRLLPALLLVALMCLGWMKLVVGLNRHRPVEFLFFLDVVTACLAVLMLALPAWRTRAGDRVLSGLRQRNVALRTAASSSGANLAPMDLALAFALFGPSMLVSGDLGALRRVMWPPGSGGGCGGGSCGGGSC